jgi:hypothetical protein
MKQATASKDPRKPCSTSPSDSPVERVLNFSCSVADQAMEVAAKVESRIAALIGSSSDENLATNYEPCNALELLVYRLETIENCLARIDRQIERL